MAHLEYQITVTIPAGEDVTQVQKAIRKARRGCRFEATAFGVLGTHGSLIVRAPDKAAAATALRSVVTSCRLRPGL